MKKIKRTTSFNAIIQKPQTLNSKHNLIIGIYFHSQDVEKHKKDKIVTLSFRKFVDFYHFSVPEELRISDMFFAILLTKILIDNRKRVLTFIKNKKDKKLTNN